MPGNEPMLFQAGMSNTPAVVVFEGTVVYGTTSVASYKGKNLTITRPNAGQLKIVLPRSYARRVGFTANWGKYAAGAVYIPVILTDSCTNAADPHFIIETRTETGTATDPASGNELDFVLSVTLDALNV